MKITRKSPPPPPEPLLASVHDVAVRCRISVETVRRFTRLGSMPQPVRVGNRTIRYRLSEIDAWISNGCPDLSDGPEVAGA